MKTFNPFKVAYFHLYILQLEEYNLKRFLNTIQKLKGTPPPTLRKKIDWTPKINLLLILSVALQIMCALIISIFFTTNIFELVIITIVFFLLFYFFFVFVTIAHAILSPFDFLIKHALISKAKREIKSFPNLRIIGIAGSYGKTTMKELIFAVLSQKFKVLKTQNNINTPLGISRLISQSLTNDIQMLIVEMGEYYKGDIKKICEITQPDVSVVTGINEAHLERLGSLKNAISTIFEVVVNGKIDSTVALNADDVNVYQNYKEYVKETQKIILYGYKDQPDEFHIQNNNFDEASLFQTFEIYKNHSFVASFKTYLLGQYAIGNILGCFKIATELGMNIDDIKRGILEMKPIKHRLEPILNNNTNVLVIDDSYNGNPAGVEEAIQLLSKFTTRRKIFLTPGLVETSDKMEEIHYNIGIHLSKVADKVILIKNSVTPFIAKGLTESGFNSENSILYNTVQEAHARLGEVLKPNDVILFQNDWPDNYV